VPPHVRCTNAAGERPLAAPTPPLAYAPAPKPRRMPPPPPSAYPAPEAMSVRTELPRLRLTPTAPSSRVHRPSLVRMDALPALGQTMQQKVGAEMQHQIYF
jgi:hypothetical protein